MREWIKNEGKCPVPRGTNVNVRYRDGKVQYAIPALVACQGTRDAQKEFWIRDGVVNDIVEWQYHEAEKSIDDFVEVVSNIQAIGRDPKQSVGLAKLPLHLWSPLATAYGALGLSNGAGKYGIANYKATHVVASIYVSATMRHLMAWLEGQENDPVDGSPHLAAILANIAIILDSRSVGMLVDDRPIPGGYVQEVDKLTGIYQDLQKQHEGKNPHHYTLNNA